MSLPEHLAPKTYWEKRTELMCAIGKFPVNSTGSCKKHEPLKEAK